MKFIANHIYWILCLAIAVCVIWAESRDNLMATLAFGLMLVFCFVLAIDDANKEFTKKLLVAYDQRESHKPALKIIKGGKKK